MLLLPRMMNSKHSVESLLFPFLLSITFYFCPLYFSVFIVTVLLLNFSVSLQFKDKKNEIPNFSIEILTTMKSFVQMGLVLIFLIY